MDGLFGAIGLVVMSASVAAGVRYLVAQPGMGIVRPFQDDPWPVGVQEDDDFRFDWRTPPENDVADVAGPDGDRPEVLEGLAEPVTLERPARVEIRPRS